MTFDSSSYLKNISRIGAGNFLVKVVGLGATPFISRLYLPEHFGELSYVVSVVSVLGVFSTLRLSEAVAIERNIERRKALIQASFVLVFLVALWGPGFTLLVDPGMSLELAVVVGILLATKGVCEVMMGLAINQKAYGTIATTRVRQSIYSTAAKVLLGLSQFTSYGLLIGQMALDGGGVVVLARRLQIDIRSRILSGKEMLSSIAVHKAFVLYQTPSQVVLMLNKSIVVFVISSLFGKESLGQYAFALTLSSLPIALLATPIADVFYGEVASLSKDKPSAIRDLTWYTTKRTLLLLPVIAVYLWLLSTFFIVVFGDEWTRAPFLVLSLMPIVLSRFWAAPIMKVFNVFGWQQAQLGINVARMTCIILVLGCCWIGRWSFEETVMSYSVVVGIFNVGCLIWTLIRLDATVNTGRILTKRKTTK